MTNFTDEKIDSLLDSVLRVFGSAMRHFSMQKTIDAMRQAMRDVLSDNQIANNFIALADELPPLGVPVLVAWEKNPFANNDKPLVARQAHTRIDVDEEGSMWIDAANYGDPADWEPYDLPTHWAPWPELKVSA